MGRNRKKKGKNTVKDKKEETANYESFLNELEDFLWVFEDIHANNGNESTRDDYDGLPFPTKRELFAHSLESMASWLNKKQEDYLNMESVAHQIRMQGRSLISDLTHKRSELLSQLEGLKSFVRDEHSKCKNVDYNIKDLDMTEMVLLTKSIFSQFLKQLDLDYCIIQSSIDSLTNIYDTVVKKSSQQVYDNEDDDPFDFLQFTSLSEQYRIWASAIRSKMEIDSILFDTILKQLDDAKMILKEGNQ